jgi:predicted PurR-regulated permease PerM
MTAQHHAFPAAVTALVLTWGIDQTFDLLVKPNLVGRRIHLHPITALFSVFAGYSLFGFAGLLVGMPLAASIKIVLAKWVPVVGAEPHVRAPKEPLMLDVGRFASDAWSSVKRWSESIVEPLEHDHDRGT